MIPIVRLTLRLPEELHARIRALAIREGRTLHGQILYLLRKAMNDDHNAE